MTQSEVYCRLSARVHAANRGQRVQTLARRYTAALQVFESRLTRNTNARNKEAAQRQQQQQEDSEDSLGESKDSFKKDAKVQRKWGVPGPKGGIWCWVATLCQRFLASKKNVFVAGAVWDELWLAHHRCGSCSQPARGHFPPSPTWRASSRASSPASATPRRRSSRPQRWTGSTQWHAANPQHPSVH
ncbi:hypothetical protein GWK47_010101 [Chionoecetes opilio]|uniref:Uncharacterized protein n=1 Tax=Chionoecetes opilio TaxID=41210 RepID=A0A8J4XY25_CHIOP|nr:hypothetical protein GWK47_010101 [Chionoecetes opilio]